MSTHSSTETNATATTVTSATSTNVNPEKAVAFAALILADDNVTVTPEKLQAILKAANITEVEPIWTTLFANALKGKDVRDILTTVATSGSAGGDVPAHNRGCDDHSDEAYKPDSMDAEVGSDSDEDAMCTFGFFD